jgi:hypothetical protein
MSKLKLGPLQDDRPVKLTVELPASVFRDLLAYAKLLSEIDDVPIKPEKVVPLMLARFMATDRGFRAMKKEKRVSTPN